MASVNVKTERTSWGATHLVTGPKADVKEWCRYLELTSSNRVFARDEGRNTDGSYTYRVDVDSNATTAISTPQGNCRTGPGWMACIAMGVGLGFLFGG